MDTPNVDRVLAKAQMGDDNSSKILLGAISKLKSSEHGQEALAALEYQLAKASKKKSAVKAKKAASKKKKK